MEITMALKQIGKFFLRFFAIVTLGAFFVQAGIAQTLYGSLTGVVTDQASSVIPNTQVTVTNPATGLTRIVTTDAAGTYQFTDLPPGSYDVTFTAASFG